MSRYRSGSHRDPYLIHADRHSQMNSLNEAKLAAWAFAIGELSPERSGSRRRPRRGGLPDLPSPEPPLPGSRQPWIARVGRAVMRLLGMRGAIAEVPPAPVPAMAAETGSVAYIKRAAPENDVRLDADEAAARPHAA